MLQKRVFKCQDYFFYRNQLRSLLKQPVFPPFTPQGCEWRIQGNTNNLTFTPITAPHGITDIVEIQDGEDYLLTPHQQGRGDIRTLPICWLIIYKSKSAWVTPQGPGYVCGCWQVRITLFICEANDCPPVLTTGLHWLVRSRPQQASDSERPAPVFTVLYLYQPKRQNKYNFLRPASVPNYTPQKARTPNAHNEILSRCFYSLTNFFTIKTNQANKKVFT